MTKEFIDNSDTRDTAILLGWGSIDVIPFSSIQNADATFVLLEL